VFLRGELAFRLLIDAVEDYAIFLLSTDGTIQTWNLGAERIKGYTAAEIVGQHFSVFYTPEEREAGRPMRLLGWAAERGRFEDEGWRVRKDGTRFWADVIVTALRDENGRPYAFAKITRDLTERRAAEEQERHLLAERQARAAAEEALLVRDRFLSIASHELKTPVATIRLAAESLLHARDAGRLDDARLDAGLRRIASGTERLGALVDELLDLSRLTADATALRTAPTDVTAVTRDVIARFADADQADRIHLVSPPVAVIDADELMLDQVVTNLVDNALKYSAPAGNVDVAVRAADGGIELEVGDRGIGFDDTTADRIFEAFGRGENAEPFPGLGLGLHITRQIVERHGGRIAAVPRTDGPGAIFTIWLPRRAVGAGTTPA
jgi:PAS domain S-box-containing protein